RRGETTSAEPSIVLKSVFIVSSVSGRAGRDRRGSVFDSLPPTFDREHARATCWFLLCHVTVSSPPWPRDGSRIVPAPAEAVAGAGRGHEVHGILRIGFELAAQPIHEVVDRTIGAEVVRPPDRIEDALPWQKCALVPDQEPEQPHLQRRHLHRLAAPLE